MKTKKIFCIGLSRTGTTSIDHCLKILGYKSIHFPISLFAYPTVINSNLKFSLNVTKSLYRRWRALKERKALYSRNDAKSLLDSYDAFSDLPIPLYYKELSLKYPDSKFIYSTRSMDSWLKSMKWMYQNGKVLWKWGYLNDELSFKMYGSKTFNEKRMKESFLQHERDVYDYFKDKPDRLLVIDLEAKKPIINEVCNFLEIPVPDISFPKVNEKVDVAKMEKVRYFLSRHIPFYFLISKRKKLNH